MNAPAKIGHNMPPDPIDEATAPFADVIAEAENWLDGSPVENAAQMRAVDTLLKGVKDCLKSVKTGEESEAKPLHDAWKDAKARWKPTIDDLERIKSGLVSLVDAFKRQEAARIAEEQRRARDEAERKMREAAEAARQADAGNIEAVREAAEIQAAAEAAQKEAAALSREKVKGLRQVWKHEITDMKAALHWIARNDKPAVEAFVTGYVNQHFRHVSIDGVKAWSEKEAF